MSIPFYRYVEDSNDGCSIYQCLNCYDTIEIRNIPFNYCPNCGIKYSKLECREHHIPKWEYVLYGPYDDRSYEIRQQLREIKERVRKNSIFKSPNCWAIEKRTIRGVIKNKKKIINDQSNWALYKISHLEYNIDLKDIIVELKFLRNNYGNIEDDLWDDTFIQDEFRATMKPRSSISNYYSTSMIYKKYCNHELGLLELWNSK